jgi:hypothetical protein
MSVPAVDRVLPDATVEPAAGTHPCVAPAAGSGLDARQVRLVEVAEGIRDLYPEAYGITVSLLVPRSEGPDDHTSIADGPLHVHIERRDPAVIVGPWKEATRG